MALLHFLIRKNIFWDWYNTSTDEINKPLQETLEASFKEALEQEREALLALITTAFRESKSSFNKPLPPPENLKKLINAHIDNLMRYTDRVSWKDPEITLKKLHQKNKDFIVEIKIRLGAKMKPSVQDQLNACLARLQVKVTQPPINHTIGNIAKQGEKLNLKENIKSQTKAQENLALARELGQETRAFYLSNAFEPLQKQAYGEKFATAIYQKEESLSLPRSLWKPIFTIVVMALSVVGIVDVVDAFREMKAKNKTTSGKKPLLPQFWWQTTSQKKAEKAKNTAKKVLDSIPKTSTILDKK